MTNVDSREQEMKMEDFLDLKSVLVIYGDGDFPWNFAEVVCVSDAL